MAASDPFPPYQPSLAALSRQEVVDRLLAARADGHRIFTEGDGYAIELEDGVIGVRPAGDRWSVRLTRLGNFTTYGDAGNLQELERLLVAAARTAGHAWPSRPASGRLAAATPASNFLTLSRLIGGANVEAVFDPYLDNGALAVLLDILSFGSGGVADGVRLLGSTHKTGGAIPKFTSAGVAVWLTQLGITGAARVMAPAGEHRRFLLLSGGQSLILGPSLNAIHKNEAVRTEPDALDRPFFDAAWAAASPL